MSHAQANCARGEQHPPTAVVFRRWHVPAMPQQRSARHRFRGPIARWTPESSVPTVPNLELCIHLVELLDEILGPCVERVTEQIHSLLEDGVHVHVEHVKGGTCRQC